MTSFSPFLTLINPIFHSRLVFFGFLHLTIQALDPFSIYVSLGFHKIHASRYLWFSLSFSNCSSLN